VIYVHHIAKPSQGGSLRLRGPSLSSSKFVFCLMLSFCAQEAVSAEMQRQSEVAPALHISTLASVSAPTYDAEEGLIKLDVVVTDKLGKPISGIARKDFKLLDNGQPDKILTFHANDGTPIGPDPPVKIILLIDTLNLPERLASYERREVARFLQQNGGHLAQPVSLVELSNMGVLRVGQPSADGNALAEEFAHNKNLEWIRRVSSSLRGESLNSVFLDDLSSQKTQTAPLSVTLRNIRPSSMRATVSHSLASNTFVAAQCASK
jgi:VWFA-related protein